LCLVYQTLDQEIKKIINLKHKKVIINIDKLNAKVIDLNYFNRNEVMNEFNTIADSQYYDDNISVRLLDYKILYYKTFNEIGPKYCLVINKKKSSIILKNKLIADKYANILDKLFDSQNIIVTPNVTTL